MAPRRRSNRDSDHRHRREAWDRPVTLRLATGADATALDRLAQLDSRPLPPGPYLLGERDGRIEAAISLASGEVISDPFRRTVEVCELLRCHGGQARLGPKRRLAAPPVPKPRLRVRIGATRELPEEQPV